MKTPVLIAAYNEADQIRETLSGLPRAVEPIVIPNGCSDNTGKIAEEFGVTVLEREEQGKLPALQSAVRHLGHRATEPFITLDADSRPVIAAAWLSSLFRARQRLPENKPAVVVGSSIFTHKDPVATMWFLAGQMRGRYRTRESDTEGDFCGRNMLFHYRTEEAIEDLLQLPHIWPGEDMAMKDVAIEHGGKALKTLDPRAMVFTLGDRFPSTIDRLKYGRGITQRVVHGSYIAEAAPGSVVYPAWVPSQERPSPPTVVEA